MHMSSHVCIKDKSRSRLHLYILPPSDFSAEIVFMHAFPARHCLHAVLWCNDRKTRVGGGWWWGGGERGGGGSGCAHASFLALHFMCMCMSVYVYVKRIIKVFKTMKSI